MSKNIQVEKLDGAPYWISSKEAVRLVMQGVAQETGEHSIALIQKETVFELRKRHVGRGKCGGPGLAIMQQERGQRQVWPLREDSR